MPWIAIKNDFLCHYFQLLCKRFYRYYNILFNRLDSSDHNRIPAKTNWRTSLYGVARFSFLITATGPILTGQFKQITEAWQASLIFVNIIILIGAIAGCLAERRAYWED